MSRPNYEEAGRALKHDYVFELVAAYLQSSAIVKCCAVSQDWRKIFQPILFENPLDRIRTLGKFSGLDLVLEMLTRSRWPQEVVEDPRFRGTVQCT